MTLGTKRTRTAPTTWSADLATTSTRTRAGGVTANVIPPVFCPPVAIRPWSKVRLCFLRWTFDGSIAQPCADESPKLGDEVVGALPLVVKYAVIVNGSSR